MNINLAMFQIAMLLYIVMYMYTYMYYPQASLQVLEEATAQLWWAGKEVQRGKKLCDFVGRNEKTKIIAKLQKVWVGIVERGGKWFSDTA